ncbi:hypothetical protein Tco_0488801 [Tanacetum coccineum]
MEDRDMTMEEYVQYKTEKALKNAIVYNDALASKSDFSSEPTIVFINDLKLDMDNGDDKFEIKQSSGDISIKPLPNVISINDDTYAQGSNELLETIIMEYLVKISKKARILKLKRRHLKIIVLTSYTPYPSRKIRHICACTSQKTTKDS